MTLKEFYIEVKGSYESLMTRIPSDEKALKYLKMFCNDSSMKELHDAIDAKNFENAFRAVHTLKGISANLSLDDFYKACCDLTEIFRHYDGADYRNELSVVDEKYNNIIQKISEIQ